MNADTKIHFLKGIDEKYKNGKHKDLKR